MTDILDQSSLWTRLTKANGRLLATLLICWCGFSEVFAAPKITTQPVNQSVSLGAKVTHQVSANSSISPILFYQWRFNDADIAGAINRTLVLTNVQMLNAGGYSVVVADT